MHGPGLTRRDPQGDLAKMLEAFGFVFQILGAVSLTWAILVLYILIKNGHLKSNVAYVPAAGLAAANVGQLVLLVGHLSPALYAYSIHGTPEDPCDGIFIILWYGSLGNVLVMAVSRCWVTWRPTHAKHFFTLRRMVICSASGFLLGLCVSALPYLNICCHFAFQISSRAIDDITVTPLQAPANGSIQTVLSVNYSVVVPASDNEYLTIIKTNNVLLLTHIVDFLTVFVSIICYGLVFCRVRQHGNKISAQQHQHHQSPHSSPIAASQAHTIPPRRRQTVPRSRQPNVRGDCPGISDQAPARTSHVRVAHRLSTRNNTRQHVGSSRQITSTSDVRMLRRISIHFCLMSSAVMFFSVILLIVHRYPNEPALVLLHQLFYILTATVNSFLISTLNEKIRSDFRRSLCQFKLCCKPQAASQSQSQGCYRLCGWPNNTLQTNSAPGRSNEAGVAQITVPTSAPPMVVFDLARP